jgi:integrase
MPFSIASVLWLKGHSQYIQASSLKNYEHKRKKLEEFFKEMPLGSFHIGHIRAYQDWRKQQVNPEMVNSEVGTVLIPMLAEIELWPAMVKVYRGLPVPPKRTRQSMTEDEMRRLITVALDSSKSRRLLAGHCLLVMSNTGLGFGELKHLRRRDVILNEHEPYVSVNEGLKNPFRQRLLPLNWIALRSMKWILRRWEDMGGTEPEQYVLPHLARRAPDDKNKKKKSEPIFTEPMLTIWNAARKILNEAGLSHLDPYDCRSHFATKIMENPDVSEMEAGEWIGHSRVAREMNRRYFAPKMKKMVKAVEKVAVDPEPMQRLFMMPRK